MPYIHRKQSENILKHMEAECHKKIKENKPIIFECFDNESNTILFGQS
jgi:hypothetical protein